MMQDDRVPINAINISKEQLEAFYQEVANIPSYKSRISGFGAALVFQFMEDTGLRVSEAIHVRKKDIDFETRLLIVTRPKVSKRCKCATWKNKNDYSNSKTLEYADPACPDCHGKGRYKKPQKTTITPRIKDKLELYCQAFQDDDIIFPISRVSLWEWAKKAGERVGLRIFVSKDEVDITNMFNHFFRALCTIRMKRDAATEEFKEELIMAKRRDTYESHVDRYTKVDINYLLDWEKKVYGNKKV